MRNIVKSAFVRACITFTVAMALWCTAGLIFAGPVEGIVITLSLLAAALPCAPCRHSGLPRRSSGD